ncbi:MAG: tetratricopeptide repeat protein [Deltaproteobacteria bacterium]|nr:tetratricopeptide repeat protein [Deltaproteobacteria bacterium]
MKPLDPLSRAASGAVDGSSPIERLLREAPPDEVRGELERLDGLELAGAAGASRAYAHGALALREGRLDEAYEAFDRSALALEEGGEPEAAALARCEAWLTVIRRGPRKVFADAIEGLEAIAAAQADSQLVQVVAAHYRGTALRYSGRAEATLGVLLDAFRVSDGLFSERAQVLNSLGTLYVVLGAYGAARSVLEHAAELNHQIGDRVSEAISYGQLGSAALALGELPEARRFLQKQEWFASRVGDAFGQSRALVLLGDLAIDLGRPDDAVDLAEQARTLAGSVTPPLNMWIAYATRTIGRAKMDLGDADALAALEAARERFRKIGNQLGEALVTWDLARHGAGRPDDGQRSSPDRDWYRSAWAFASLGLTARVAQVLTDLRALTQDSGEALALDLAIAAAGQSYAHLSASHEVELVFTEADTLAAIATRRIAGQRNLGRIAAQCVAGAGLYLAAIAAGAIGTGIRMEPKQRCEAALLGQLPGLALWAWDASACSLSEVARDLSSVRVSLGDDTRVTLGHYPEGRVRATPFAGELGAELSGADLGPLMSKALADPPATLRRLAGCPWDGEAEALARMSGYRSVT